MSELVIRPMEIDDLDGVFIVESKSFSDPWRKDIFYKELTGNMFAHYFVAEINNEIIGYAGMWIVLDDAQITNIAISPLYRGKKYGEKLFYYIMKHAILMGTKRLSLEVRASNIIAQKMYRKFGLKPGGIRKNYYTDNQEDAIVMWVNLN